MLVAGIEPAPTVLCHGCPRPRLCQLSYTNIEAVAHRKESNLVLPDSRASTASDGDSYRFDVGPPFVGQEPLTRSTEELLAGGLVRAPAGGSI